MAGDRPAMSMAAIMQKRQPLTPVSPLLPTALPHVYEPIPPLPMTPPDADEILDHASNEAALRTGLHVMATERDGISHLHELYQNDPIAQEGFLNAVNAISRTIHRGGKLIISGIGKSGKIGEKLVATMNSLEIRSAWLHPTEALHGDLGMIGVNDAILLLTFSGRTLELQSLLHHIRPTLPLLVITSHTNPSTCPLFNNRPMSNCILLPASIPRSETDAFGLPAPTTSTTVALALGDGLALAVANRLHPSPPTVFHTHHPGGAIGASATSKGPQIMSDIAIDVASVPLAQYNSSPSPNETTRKSLTALDILLTAAGSPSGWVRLSNTCIVSPRRIQTLASHLDRPVHQLDEGVVVEKTNWISVPGASTIEEARAWIRSMRSVKRGRTFLRVGTMLGIVDGKGEVSGIVDIEDVVVLGNEGEGDGMVE